MASILTRLALSRTSRFVTLSCYLMPITDLRDLWWNCSICFRCFLYSVQVLQPYRRLLSTIAFYVLIMVANLMFLLFRTLIRRRQRGWLALLICTEISLSSEPSEEMMLPMYLTCLTVFSSVATMVIVGRGALEPGAGWNRRSYWRSESECTMRAQSLANSASRISRLVFLDIAFCLWRSKREPSSLYCRYTPLSSPCRACSRMQVKNKSRGWE